MVQPAESREGLVLWSRPGSARVAFGGATRSFSLRAGEELTEIVETADGWVAAGRRSEAGKSRLFVVAGGERRSLRRLEAPAGATSNLQLRPRLLTTDGRLSGIAWLEGAGARRLEVRSRAWTGADWGPEVIVSPPAQGSQTGLATTTLRNGTEILVWAAFDGNDDEILFSETRAGAWSRPNRIAAGNRVPDVAPAIIASGRGALAAWSRFDGEKYELVLTRYRRGVWRAPRVVATGGALFPQFVRLDDRLFLLYRTAEPRGWSVLEIGDAGGVVRRAGFLETAPDRPSIHLEPTGIDLHWPDAPIDRGYWDVP